ncbi:MAG: alpha-glucosidase [Hyphomonadaceae bacterium]|nr:MAG: alpha-glucosidase [Hyphomonadaceae bacterium]KAF0185963.1 MAG: alpha-glucosidase [Hyphomonadaceae bacterium]
MTKFTKFFALIAFLVSTLIFSNPANAEVVGTATSPSNIIQVNVELDGEGRIMYSVNRFGRQLIAPSLLGFLMQDTGRMERGFELTGKTTATHDETWEQPWGERRFVRDNHNEVKVNFKEKTGAKRALNITFRVFDDGIGFRYEFPNQGQTLISDEITEFRIAPPTTAWWIPAGEPNRYEQLYRRTPLAEVTQAHTPITMRTNDGVYLSFHEAALVDYSGMWLRRTEGQVLRAQLAPAPDGVKVRRTGPFSTPWRTIVIADRAGGLSESDLILNLNEPNKLGDVSWVIPHKYVGVWWEMHLDTKSWNSGPKHGATTENTKRFIDFAAANGFRSVLVEGWNLGWDGNWFANGREFNFTQPYPDYNMRELAAYARSKGVHIMGHHETGANICVYERQLGAALDYARDNGMEAIKTGYVADAGGIITCDEPGREVLMWHDGQRMARHHLQVVTEAAKRHIAINPHEPIKDTGLRRTYPNWVSREGARGQEYNAWGVPPNPPEHEANLFFTRMLSGPMDFTPGVLSLVGRGGQKIESTLAKQLALYVVLYSPIQMAADLPENYAKYMDAFQFIRDVPTDWHDSKVLAGEIGDYVVVARRDRNSQDWYIGAVTDEMGRNLNVSLGFLAPGKHYLAQIYRDGNNADWNSNQFEYVIGEKRVTSSDMLQIRMAAGGGQAIRFKALD